MANFRVTMQHSEDTFLRLSKKQYDLFCQSNRIVRSLIAGVCIMFGLVYHESTWTILLIAYGCYLITSTYAQANHTARKMAEQIRQCGMPFPSSRYEFKKNYMEITILPERDDEEPKQVKYKDLERIAEDGEYFFLFRDQYGGYMVPKEQLGKQVDDFRYFLEKASGQLVVAKAPPWVKLVRRIASAAAKR